MDLLPSVFYGGEKGRLAYLNSYPEMVFTPLDELFALVEDPYQATSYAQECLDMLVEAGYEIDEVRLHLDQNLLTYPGWPDGCGVFNNMSLQLLFDVDEDTSVSWDWWVDPASPASLVRQEFRHMNNRHRNTYLGPHWEEAWPFIYPRLSKHRQISTRDISCVDGRDWFRQHKDWERRADQAAHRYARQAKKKYKAFIQDSELGLSIPGAWDDDKY